MKTRKVWGVVVLARVVLFGGTMLVVGSCFTPGTALNQGLAGQVVTAIAHGTLKSDPYGAVTLPARYGAVSVTGRVHVNRGSKGLLLIWFPNYYGHTGTGGYLYVSRPLRPGDTLGPNARGDNVRIMFRYFLFPTGRLPFPSRVTVPPSEFALRKLSAHWYETFEPE